MHDQLLEYKEIEPHEHDSRANNTHESDMRERYSYSNYFVATKIQIYCILIKRRKQKGSTKERSTYSILSTHTYKRSQLKSCKISTLTILRRGRSRASQPTTMKTTTVMPTYQPRSTR